VELTAGIAEACVLWSPFLLLQTEVALADVEILGRIGRRRKWTAQEKASLLAEVEAEGGKVTIVARRHRISESVLYNWRAAWKAAAVMQASVAAPFIPLGVLGGSSHQDAAMLTLPAPGPTEPETRRPVRTGDNGIGAIEIVLPNGARVSVDAFVNEKALSRVLRAMKGST
jgi:transposase